MRKQRKDAKRKINNGLDFTDARTINLRNKIKRLQTSIQLFKKRNIKERRLKNEEKIKQKQLQLKKINEQLKEVLNDALKKFISKKN